MNKKVLITIFVVVILWGLFFVFKKDNVSQKTVTEVKPTIQTNNLSNSKSEKVRDVVSNNVKNKENNKNNEKDNELILEKEEINKDVSKYYLNPWIDLFEKEDNLRLELYNKFSKANFLKYTFLALLRWDYGSIEKIKNYYKRKFGKNILSWYKRHTYIINVNKKVDYIKVNWKDINENNNRFIYETYFPFNINIIVYKKWCVPMLDKNIGYMTKKNININFVCVKMKEYKCSNKNSKIKIWKLQADLSNVCWNNWVRYVDYAYLNGSNAKKLWYLNLPVFDQYWYKLLAQSFDTYWMPVIILKNKDDSIVNKCVPVFYKYNYDQNKYNHLTVNRYFDAVYWQKKWFPWWWNLNLVKWIRYAGYQQIYDKTDWTFLAKYCYVF